MRKTRGDGNCFFRAFAFGLIESVSRQPRETHSIIIAKLASRVNELLAGAGFERLAYEDFYDEFIATLRETAEREEMGADWLAEEWQSNAHRSHSIVVLLR